MARFTDNEFTKLGTSLTAKEFVDGCIEVGLCEDLLDQEGISEKQYLERCVGRLNQRRKTSVFGSRHLWIIDDMGEPRLVHASYEEAVREIRGALEAHERQKKRLSALFSQFVREGTKP